MIGPVDTASEIRFGRIHTQRQLITGRWRRPEDMTTEAQSVVTQRYTELIEERPRSRDHCARRIKYKRMATMGRDIGRTTRCDGRLTAVWRGGGGKIRKKLFDAAHRSHYRDHIRSFKGPSGRHLPRFEASERLSLLQAVQRVRLRGR